MSDSYILFKVATAEKRWEIFEAMQLVGYTLPSYFTLSKKFGMLLRVKTKHVERIQESLSAIDANFEVLGNK